jgi:hypothetical protein
LVLCQLLVVGCGLWVVGCGLWVVGCGLWVVVVGCKSNVTSLGIRMTRLAAPLAGRLPLFCDHGAVRASQARPLSEAKDWRINNCRESCLIPSLCTAMKVIQGAGAVSGPLSRYPGRGLG